MEEEISFPRGGYTPSNNEKSKSSKDDGLKKSSSARKEKRKRSQSDDFLFGTKVTEEDKIKKTKKKLKTSSSSSQGKASASTRSHSEISTTSGALAISSSVLPIGGGAVLQPTTGASSKAAFIEGVSFQKLAKGTKLLGIVREVSSDYALVSLPNMLTGYIRRDEKAKLGLDQMIQVGMVLSVVVLKATSETVAQTSSKNHRPKDAAPVVKKRIELSISPIHVNDGWTSDTLYESMTLRGKIKSIEDHGCIVDVSVAGVGGNSCFLKFDNIEGGYTLVSDDDEEEEKDGEEEDDDAMEVTDDSPNQKSDSTFIIKKGRIYDFTVKSMPSKFDKTSSTSIIQLSLETSSTRSKKITEPTMQPSKKSSSFTLRSLNAGMLVSISVEHHARNGLCVTFLGNVFRGSIEMSHLGGFFSDKLSSLLQRLGKETSSDKKEMWWKEVFAGKLSNVVARIIVIDPVAKIIRLSLLPHILNLATPSMINQPCIGAMYEGARVIRLDPGVGALLALPNTTELDEDEGKAKNHDKKDKSLTVKNTKIYSNPIYKLASTVQSTYLHISKALDNDDGSPRTSESYFNKRFATGSIIPKLRILSTSNWLDNIASCGTAESILSSVALSHEDLSPGAIYKSVPIVANFKGGSVLVQLGAAGLTGIIPSHHLFDHVENISSTSKTNTSRSKQRMEKFKVGNKIDVRCLCVDPIQRKCTLTAKASLLASDVDDPIIDYSSIEKGRLATGFISRVSEHGLNVTFYNNVFGSISARRLADEKGIEDPRSDFTFGDVIKVRVVKCLESEKTGELRRSSFLLDLSLNLEPGDMIQAETLHGDTSKCFLRSGSVLPANTIKVVELCDSQPKAEGEGIIPGHAIVTVRTKDVQALLNETGTKRSFYCKLPFEHLLDKIPPEALSSTETLNAFARQHLAIGQKITQESVVLSYDNTAKMNLLSLKPQLVQTARNSSSESTDIILPSSSSSLYMGAYVYGSCTRIDPRYGAFIRFLDNLSGLIPKVKGGLDIGLYNSVLCRVLAIDLVAGKTPKILLKEASLSKKKNFPQDDTVAESPVSINVGDSVGDVRVDSMNFARAAVTLIDPKFTQGRIKARIHVTMADPLREVKETLMPLIRAKKDDTQLGETSESQKITKYHPFYTWKVGCVIRNVQCVFVNIRDGIIYLELTNRLESEIPSPSKDLRLLSPPPLFVESPSDLKQGIKVSCVITNVSRLNRGIWVQICPGVSGFIPGLDLCDDVKVLNALSKYFKIGGRINCWVVSHKIEASDKTKDAVRLSAREYILRPDGSRDKKYSPARGDLIIGRINRTAYIQRPPAVMLELQGGITGRCDITELKDFDEWSNMPLGRSIDGENAASKLIESAKSRAETIETHHEFMPPPSFDDEVSSVDEHPNSEYFHGRYVRCRILSSSISSSSVVDVSLRTSRLDGNLEDDKLPEVNDLAQAYVVSTTKKGCFLRLSRFVEGRVLLKDLSDSFIHDPVSMFPTGRLVVGRVQAVRDMVSNKAKRFGAVIQREVDLNMRESAILEDKNKIRFEDIMEGQKYGGIVTRVESFGVFVRFNNSDVSGLAHLSECSDDYIKNLSALYDPGDLVKALVIKIDPDLKRVALSLKASHFDGDADMSESDEESAESEEEDESTSSSNNDEIDDYESDDENYIDRLRAHVKNGQGSDTDDSDNEDEKDHSSLEDEDIDSSEESVENMATMDTNVGFDWGNIGMKSSKDANLSGSEDESEDSDGESDSDESGTNAKSRKRGLGKLQEEKEISSKELRIASGAADENPETVSDFERLLASNPDSSENWIRYMAFHLSLSDIDSARLIANRAIERIEFRREGERLNIWTALLTLELKYGTIDTFQNTIERAAQQNNPKQVYLRVCELLERESDDMRNNHNTRSHEYLSLLSRTDEMFSKMVKKFKTKKTVWIAYCKYLLKLGRHEVAHDVSKRAMSSLPSYKHIEAMSKFAQLEYELGSAERAKTVFEALIDKYPKRLDLFFVFIDKEVKYGEMDSVRKVFERTISDHNGNRKVRYSDKQMKSLFKKWFKLEELHGNEKTRQHVKNEAKRYVENSMKTDD